MARSPDVLRDETPLDAPMVDVPLRVGWLLRTCRLNAPASSGLTGKDVAEEVGVNPALVTRWEKGTEDIDRSGIEVYERLTGTDPALLRSAIDLTRRIGRHRATRTTDQVRGTLDELSTWAWPAI